MFDLGFTELMVIGVVALIVVGPKDLPKLFRTLGQFTGKARAMAREFTSAMNSAADGAGVGDLKKMGDDIRSATSAKNMGLDSLNNIGQSLDEGKLGPNTAALAEKRKEQAQKIRELSEQKAKERQAREAGEAAPAFDPDPVAEAPAPDPDAKPAPKPAAKKPTAKKPAAKKPAAKKPAAKKAPPKKAAPKKANAPKAAPKKADPA